MTTISDPSAMTPDDPRWLSWFMQQRRFDRLSRKAQTGASLITDFASGVYEMGYPGQRRGSYELSDIVKVSRSTGGGRFNSSGVYEWVGNDVPRFDYDPVTLQPRGLLIEEQRTNLLTRSTDFTSTTLWQVGEGASTTSANTAIAPNGLMEADTFTPGITAGALGPTNTTDNRIWAELNTTNNTFTFSVWVRTVAGPASFKLYLNNRQTDTAAASSATHTIGSEWVRYTVTGATTGAAGFEGFRALISANQPVYLWGAQVEVGSVATSFIPTTTAQVTRAADVASVNTLSPWYNASEGTLVAEFETFASSGTKRVATLQNVNATERFGLLVNTAGSAEALVSAGGVFQGTSIIVGATLGVIHKIAGAMSAAGVMGSLDGVNGVNTAIATPPAPDRLIIGNQLGVTQYVNGHIRNISYYPRRLSDAELQQVTA